MIISILGGTGGMGKNWAKFLKSKGFTVFPIGRRTIKQKEKIASSDVIFISVPSHALESTSVLLNETDISQKLIVSLGSCTVFDMRRLRKIKGDIAFIHALFGPKIYPFRDQNFIIAGKIDNKFLKQIVIALKKEKARIVYTTPQKHDKDMAYIQALSQFSSISLAKTISNTKINPHHLNTISTVTYRMNENTIKRILTQKAELWAHIQFENPYFIQVLDGYMKDIQILQSYVMKKNYKKFEDMYNKLLMYWNK